MDVSREGPWTQWRGERTFDEVHFLEVSLEDGRRLWIRHTLRADHDAVAAGRRVWAILTDAGGRAQSVVRREPLGGPDDGRSWQTRDAYLSPSSAVGTVAGLRWNLRLHPTSPGHAHVPAWMTRLGLGRTYASRALCLKVDGILDDGTGPTGVRGHGVLGHIYGRRNRTAAWAWAWAGHFEGDDALFEGLTARLGSPRAPTLTSLVLEVSGERHAFSDTTSLLTTWSAFDAAGWRAVASRRGHTLRLEATAGNAGTTLTYDDPPNAPIQCRNAANASLRLTLSRPGKPTKILWAPRATLEHAHRLTAAPAEPLSAP
jgi:hypothetical protein